jgi:hypothetical protein
MGIVALRVFRPQGERLAGSAATQAPVWTLSTQLRSGLPSQKATNLLASGSFRFCREH